MKVWSVRIAIFLSVFLAVGCGPYSFSASGKLAFKSINVVSFENQTIEYELTDRLYDAVIETFIQDNTVQVLDATSAEAVMTGNLTSYRRDPYNYDAQDAVSQYAVKVTFHVKVVKAASEDVIWEEDFYAEGIYDANSESETEEGQQRVIDKITADILDKTTKSW
ncbi:MAG: LPS assembly lipoprotein LptE [Candidatus Zixiibacteriota bacterium]